MLKWCSYCQQFMREVAPYDSFQITHGLCSRCESAHEDLFAKDVVEHGRFLRATFQALLDAGRQNDFEVAARVIERAIGANCRPVDILMGMIAPMLYEIGEEWKRGVLSVQGEHRFTAFCERVTGLVERRIAASDAAPLPPRDGALLFLMNAPGDRHRLALRILALWLHNRGATLRIIDNDKGIGSLMRSVAADRPEYLLVSMALTTQRTRVVEIAKAVQILSPSVRPKMIVGGYPVKAGLIQPIPAAELVSDISALEIV